MPKGEAEVYRPAEACRIAEVAPYVLRYWETEFSALSEGRDKGSAKLYTARDVRIIARIRELLYDEGFTVAGAKKRLDAEIAEGRFDSGLAPAPPVIEQRASDKPTAKAASKTPEKASEKPAERTGARPAESTAAEPERGPAQKPAERAAPERPSAAKAAPPPPENPAAQAASAPSRREERTADPGFDRRMVVRELKEIVRILGRP